MSKRLLEWVQGGTDVKPCTLGPRLDLIDGESRVAFDTTWTSEDVVDLAMDLRSFIIARKYTAKEARLEPDHLFLIVDAVGAGFDTAEAALEAVRPKLDATSKGQIVAAFANMLEQGIWCGSLSLVYLVPGLDASPGSARKALLWSAGFKKSLNVGPRGDTVTLRWWGQQSDLD